MKIKNIVDLSDVGLGQITGLPEEDTFHCALIEIPFVRIVVTDVKCPDVALPFPNREENEVTLGCVMGKNTLWNCKFLRKVPH